MAVQRTEAESVGLQLRDETPDSPRNYGVLLSEGVQLLTNMYEALPEDQRKHFIERQWPVVRKYMGKFESNLPAAKRVLGRNGRSG